MKRSLRFALIFLLVTGCAKDVPILDATPNNLLGTWELTDVRASLGSGPGEYQPASYQRTITFYADSVYSTAVGICTFSTTTDGGTGFYSPSAGLIHPTSCRINAQYPYTIEGLRLTIEYLCIEGCAERYVKVAD